MGKKVVVVGSGVVGLATAFWLHRAGASVHVVDRGNGPGMGTSFASAGMVTPNQANPWNSPGIIGEALKSLFQRDAPLLLRLGSIPSLVGWGSG
jgi:D-amino-acid dehydrogenase